MPNSIATRSVNNFARERTDQGSETRSHTRDLGMTKRVSTSLTMTSGSAQIAGSNGDFTAFAVNDTILVQNTNLNNGQFVVTAIDGANHAFLTVDPPPKSEGPVAGIVRTI